MERVDRPPSERAELEPGAARATEIDQLRRELEAVTRQSEQYQLLLRQSREDFARYRREVESERAEQAKQVRVELLLRVLPVLDDLDAVLSDAEDEERAEAAIGAERVARLIRDVLDSEGVEKIEAIGELYNPWEHEVLQHQASPELDDERILAVVRDGYRLGDQVIRPAQVVVARRSTGRGG